jgi:hypothetical protein
MAKVKVHVWHDPKGGIVAVGHRVAHKTFTLGITPIANPNHHVLETDVEEERIAGLHKTHRVDVKKQTLVSASK